jgi:hypothetical protein
VKKNNLKRDIFVYTKNQGESKKVWYLAEAEWGPKFEMAKRDLKLIDFEII